MKSDDKEALLTDMESQIESIKTKSDRRWSNFRF